MGYDEDLKNIFIILKRLLQQPETVERKPVGFPYPNKK